MRSLPWPPRRNVGARCNVSRRSKASSDREAPARRLTTPLREQLRSRRAPRRRSARCALLKFQRINGAGSSSGAHRQLCRPISRTSHVTSVHHQSRWATSPVSANSVSANFWLSSLRAHSNVNDRNESDNTCPLYRFCFPIHHRT
jgi:hypothetical protein